MSDDSSEEREARNRRAIQAIVDLEHFVTVYGIEHRLLPSDMVAALVGTAMKMLAQASNTQAAQTIVTQMVADFPDVFRK